MGGTAIPWINGQASFCCRRVLETVSSTSLLFARRPGMKEISAFVAIARLAQSMLYPGPKLSFS